MKIDAGEWFQMMAAGARITAAGQLLNILQVFTSKHREEFMTEAKAATDRDVENVSKI